MNPFKLLSDKEILECGLDYLLDNPFSSYQECFDCKNYPFFSRGRVKKLLVWIEGHYLGEFLYFSVGNVSAVEFNNYKIKWLFKLIEEVE